MASGRSELPRWVRPQSVCSGREAARARYGAMQSQTRSCPAQRSRPPTRRRLRPTHRRARRVRVHQHLRALPELPLRTSDAPRPLSPARRRRTTRPRRSTALPDRRSQPTRRTRRPLTESDSVPQKVPPALADVPTETIWTSMPASCAVCSVRPRAATCGSVNVTRGAPVPSARSQSAASYLPVIWSAATRAWCLAMWVSSARPLASPTTQSQSWPGTCRCSSTAR